MKAFIHCYPSPLTILLALLVVASIILYRTHLEPSVKGKKVNITIVFRDGSTTAFVGVDSYKATRSDLRISRDGHTFIFDRYAIKSLEIVAAIKEPVLWVSPSTK